MILVKYRKGQKLDFNKFGDDVKKMVIQDIQTWIYTARDREAMKNLVSNVH